MNVPNPVTTVGAIPWYKSPTQIAMVSSAVSALIALFPRMGVWLHLTSPNDVVNAVTVIFGFIAVIAPVIGSVYRAKSSLQPLTLTAAAAAIHPSTIAAKVTPK